MKSIFNEWKRIRIIEYEERRKNGIKFYNRFWKTLRIIVNLFLTLALIIVVLLSKGSLLFITNGIEVSKTDTDEKKWVWMLATSTFVPYIISFFECLFKSLFDKHEYWPSLKAFCVVLLTETLNCVGTSIFIFKILPSLDYVRSILLMNCISTVPSILKLIFKDKTGSSLSLTSGFKFITKWIFCNNTSKFILFFDVIAIIMQFSVFVIIYVTSFANNCTWEIPIALILVSLSYWENFVDESNILTSRKLTAISELKVSIERSRHKTLLIITVWKIGITILVAYLFHPAAFSNKLISNLDILWHEFTIPIVVQVIASFYCYYLSVIACKLCMQRFAFALPLTLSTPISLIICLVVCTSVNDDSIIKQNFLLLTCSSDYSKGKLLTIVVLGLVFWYISHLWITRHIWYDVTHRLETRKRLFVQPTYSNVFIEQALMLYRRQDFHNQKVIFSYTHDDESSSSVSSDNCGPIKKENIGATLYCCATMWHENKKEMLKLLASIMRQDQDQRERRNAQERSGMPDADYYEYEAHIFFDDAMIVNEHGETIPNQFVQSLVSVIDEAASSAHAKTMNLDPPKRTETPYGGRLTYILPFGNQLIIHLKDKKKIRIKKRWSQVMYMYYLLGYRVFGDMDSFLRNYEYNYTSKVKAKMFKGYGNFLHNVDDNTRRRLENTFILTLDGDVEFRPEAVRLMIDKMKRHKKVGSVCGRVHPIGSGLMVWYQIFEYAVGHWLQKASEHLFGTVMCSPGCFSLLRGSTIVEDQIMRTYSTESTEASHYVQYDQGEDRWLSTLIIQQGYYIQYCSAACSQTYAPESFNEYYSQRRRWIPSTLANLFDFIKDYKHILKVNDRISYFYVIYELIILTASILGPSTVLLLLIDTLQYTLNIDLAAAYVLIVLPIVLFMIVCIKCKNDTQIFVALLLSTIYGILMIAVIVSSMSRIVDNSFINPSSVLLIILVVVYLIAAILHPREFSCIVPGILYFICLPSTFVLLQVYALFNMNNVSWGTREIKQHNTNSNLPDHSTNSYIYKIKSLFSSNYYEIRMLFENVHNQLEKIEKQINSRQSDNHESINKKEPTTNMENIQLTPNQSVTKQKRSWLDHECINQGELTKLSEREEAFFKALIKTELTPIVLTENKKVEIADSLESLRNNCCFAFCMFNALWMVLILNLQIIQRKSNNLLYITIPTLDKLQPLRYEPVTFVFVALFVVILILQFYAMLWHRYKTFLHLLVSIKTKVPSKFRLETRPISKDNSTNLNNNNNNNNNNHQISSTNVQNSNCTYITEINEFVDSDSSKME